MARTKKTFRKSLLNLPPIFPSCVAFLLAPQPLQVFAGDPLDKFKITQDEVSQGDIADVQAKGALVFSTPFINDDGFGDGPVNQPKNTIEPGGRPSLHNLMRVNGLDAQSCLECHNVVSNASVPSEFGVGGVGGLAATALPMASIFTPGMVRPDSKIMPYFNGRFINPPFVFGSGGVELLAKEITEKLQKKKLEAVRPENIGRDIVLDIDQEGVILNFGSIKAVEVTKEMMGKIQKEEKENPSSSIDKTNCGDPGLSPQKMMEAELKSPNSGIMPTLTDFIAVRTPPREFYAGNTFAPFNTFSKQNITPTIMLDTSKVVHVDPDLIIKPFGRKGNNVTTRDFDCGAFRFHMGIEPSELVSPSIDHDGDGKINEISTASVSALAIFNTTTPKPIQDDYEGNGQDIFLKTGCGRCHTPEMRTSRSKLIYQQPETPSKPFDESNVYRTVDLSETSGFSKTDKGGLIIPLYSDLRYHDMGDELAEDLPLSKEITPEINRRFITARLWGLADTAPYMHDGRAHTISEAILAHDGDARAAKNKFKELSETEKNELLKFLGTLRTPRASK